MNFSSNNTGTAKLWLPQNNKQAPLYSYKVNKQPSYHS